MTIDEKKQFITSFMDYMRDTLISEVEKMPESWDGFEIRWYIAGAFQFEEPSHRCNRSRFNSFTNDRAISNLKY